MLWWPVAAWSDVRLLLDMRVVWISLWRRSNALHPATYWWSTTADGSTKAAWAISVALEVQAAGLEGIVIWGLHRDTADIRAIGLPVFSLGAFPTGPQRLDVRPRDALESAALGDWTVSVDDLVLGDEDGVLLLPTARAGDIFTLAETIRDTERRQAELMHRGVSLRSQVQFDVYLAHREETPSLSFRDHLRGVGGAIEE